MSSREVFLEAQVDIIIFTNVTSFSDGMVKILKTSSLS